MCFNFRIVENVSRRLPFPHHGPFEETSLLYFLLSSGPLSPLSLSAKSELHTTGWMVNMLDLMLNLGCFAFFALESKTILWRWLSWELTLCQSWLSLWECKFSEWAKCSHRGQTAYCVPLNRGRFYIYIKQDIFTLHVTVMDTARNGNSESSETPSMKSIRSIICRRYWPRKRGCSIETHLPTSITPCASHLTPWNTWLHINHSIRTYTCRPVHCKCSRP